MHLDDRAGAWARLDGDFALMILDDAIHDGHSEAASAAGGFLEWIKDRFEPLALNSKSFVPEYQDNIAVRIVFQEHKLPLGTLEYNGQKIEPRAIKRTMLLTVEGEKDDICAVGQTAAAHDLCSGLRQYRKKHHMQTGVGHYGVFSGKRWEGQIYPLVKNVILSSE